MGAARKWGSLLLSLFFAKERVLSAKISLIAFHAFKKTP